MLQKGRKKINFKCTAMLNFYSLCERFICQAKTFFFSFSLFLHEKSPLCGSQLVPTLLVLLTLFFSCTRVFTFYMYVRTYISLSSSTILAPKGQRLKRTLESKLEPPYSSGHHFFWQLVSCSRLGCCHCSIFVVVANCWRFLNHFYVICAIIWQSGNLRNGRK